MKVLIINVRIGTGSVGRIVSDLYHGLIGSGNECKVAYARGSIGDLPEEDTYKICSDIEVRLHAGLTRAFGNTAFYFSKTTEKFCKWIKEYNPDIVHIHGVYGYYVHMGILFSYLASSRAVVISTLHSCWDFTGHCCYFDYIGCDEWKKGCKKCKAKSSYPSSSVLDNTARNYIKKKAAYDSLKNCVIVTPSDWLAGYVRESFLKTKDIEVINNGIDLVAFKHISSKSKYIDSTIPSILCVASIWERRKGWNDVVKLSKKSGKSFQLIVVGVSEEQKSELSNQTIAITRTNDKTELAQLYSNATVFFNPTYEDNYPTVNLEAIACGTPVVTYNTGGSPEILNGMNWGIVVKKGDFDSLFQYAKKVHSGELIPDFSKVNKLSNALMIKKYLDLYQKGLKQ